MMATMGVMAQVTGYAITSNANSKNCYAFSFDVSDPSKVVETIWTDTVSSEAAVIATLADSIYYAYMDEGTGGYDFCSINFTTGVKTFLNSALPAQGETWYDICYDATTASLYGLRKMDTYVDDELSTSSYQICTIDASTGRWTEYATLPSEIVNQSSASYYLGPICSDGNGGIYVMGATKWFSDGDVHSYFNPYDSAYNAFINYMNVLSDFANELDLALAEQAAPAPAKKRSCAPKKSAAKKPAAKKATK